MTTMMNGPRPLLVLLMAALPVAAWAQQAPPAEGDGDGGAQALVQAGVTVSPAHLWRDAHILWTATTLALSREQAQHIASLLTELQARLEATRTERAQLWHQGAEAVTAVVGAWIAGRQPAAQERAVADDVADRAANLTAQDEAAISAAIVAVQQALSPEQVALFETAEEAEMRAEALMRYEGAPSLADYIVAQVDAHRELMPDEYVAVRLADAARVADKIADPRQPVYDEVFEAVLRLFDQVSNWHDEQYHAARPTLPDRVRQYLQITEDRRLTALPHDEFRAWLKDARTPVCLAVYGTEATALPAKDDPPQDDLSRALATARLVSLLNDLELSGQQLAHLLTLTSQAKAEARQAALARDALLASAAPHLTQILPHLIRGQALNEDWNRFFADLRERLREQERADDAAMAPYVAAVERTMHPGQAAYVDWRVPPAIMGALSPTERARAKREEAAMITDALALVEFLRGLEQTLLNQLRPARVAEFLRRYMEPDTREFERARQEIYGIIQESRLIRPEQWPDFAEQVAVQVLQAAGQLRGDAPRPRGDKPLDWRAIRDLLLAPETEPVLQQMIAARAGR